MPMMTVIAEIVKEKQLTRYMGVALVLSLCGLVYFLGHKVFLIGSDTYYYMSIADSLLAEGTLRDFTVVPERPVKTPQNGIVLVFALLSSLGISHQAQLILVVFLNYLLWITTIVPVYLIGKQAGLKNDWAMIHLRS